MSLLGKAASILCLAVWGMVLPPAGAAAQPVPASQGGMVTSLGQPPLWKWYGAVDFGRSYRGSEPSFLNTVQIGTLRDLTNPVLGLLAASTEVYAGRSRSPEYEYGIRGLLSSPLLGVSFGLDASLAHGEIRPLLRLRAPVQRGGFLTRGGEVRLTWIPARSLSVGLSVPLRQPTVGRTRPRTRRVLVDEHRPAVPPAPILDPEIARAIERARSSAQLIVRLTVPYLDQGGTRERALRRLRDDMISLGEALRARGDSAPDPGGAALEVRRFHEALSDAFALAIAGDAGSLGPAADRRQGPEASPGDTAAAVARELALEHVIFPYNRLLGLDRREDTTSGFAARTRGPFTEWLVAASGIPRGRRDAVLGVFDAYLSVLEEARDAMSRSWGDRRLSWIPLQLALLPTEHDEQAELDELLSRAVGVPFLEGNRMQYLSNVEWQSELLAMVDRARDYHVLWIHDIKGKNAEGEPDAITFRYVVEGYLASLTRRVREYDRAARLPVFLIFIDQYYYELHDTRRWLSLLERPLRGGRLLPRGSERLQATLDSAVAELRRAVAESELLQRQASQYGEEWLRNQIKVHVSVTNPADPSFWGNQLFPVLGLPDNLMRDHRKLAFYDLTEEDPYRGAALFGGMGIGEHYSGAAWEDRAIEVQGPAALSAKQAALDLLDSQGFEPDEIPYPLRARARPPDFDEMVARIAARESSTTRILQVHNHTGYLEKRINVAKAMLYTLMPPGSVIIIPDSLWSSELWASMLVGSCLRGVNVLLIGPSRANAPGADGFLPMARAHELAERLLVVREALGESFERSGGRLLLALYDARVDATDATARALQALDGIHAEPAVRELLPFSRAVDSLVAEADRAAALRSARGEQPSFRPLFHAKIQLFATEQAWDVLARDEVAELFRVGLGAVTSPRETRERPAGFTDVRTLGPVFDRHLADSPAGARERAALYLMVGSSNQNYRSMLIDGEVSVIVSGSGAARAIPDFVSFLGLSTWLGGRADLDERLPRHGGLKRWLSRLFRKSI